MAATADAWTIRGISQDWQLVGEAFDQNGAVVPGARPPPRGGSALDPSDSMAAEGREPCTEHELETVLMMLAEEGSHCNSVELGSAVAAVEHQATGFLQAINATFPPSSTLVPLRIHGHRTNLGGINHSYDRLKALGVKVFHCVVSDSYPGPCAGGVAPLGGCPGDIRSDGTVSWHEWDTVIDSHIAALADKPTVYYDVRAVFFLSVASVAALLT